MNFINTSPDPKKDSSENDSSGSFPVPDLTPLLESQETITSSIPIEEHDNNQSATFGSPNSHHNTTGRPTKKFLAVLLFILISFPIIAVIVTQTQQNSQDNRNFAAFPLYPATPTTGSSNPTNTPIQSTGIPNPTSNPTSNPTPQNEPTPTLIVGQCLNIKVYKNGSAVDPQTIRANDQVEIAVVSINASKARVRVNESAWTETTVKNTANEYIVAYTVADNTTNFVIDAQSFIGNEWR